MAIRMDRKRQTQMKGKNHKINKISHRVKDFGSYPRSTSRLKKMITNILKDFLNIRLF